MKTSLASPRLFSIQFLLVVDDHLDQGLARFILGVGLAGEDEVDRPFVGQNRAEQFVDVLEDQVGPLVGRETPGETDGEDLRFQGVAGVGQMGKQLGGSIQVSCIWLRWAISIRLT